MLNTSFHIISRKNLSKSACNRIKSGYCTQYRNSFYSKISNQKISFGNKKKTFDEIELQKLGIKNLHITGENGVRGESLSCKTNRQYIPLVKKCGIKQIIDLKTADHSDNFEKQVHSQGIEYHHYPIDSDVTPTKEIIEYLPSFFRQINAGNFYIACAQGLHRTDIALAINYFFNADADCEPPKLYGHATKNRVRIDDIFKRINNIYNSLSYADKEVLGLTELNDEILKEKKQQLVEANKAFFNIT